MKHRLSDGSGFLEIDHTNSPGTDDVPGGTKFEADIMQCSHCQRGVILNPGRVRVRAVCGKCHHYVCDSCAKMLAATGECVPFKAVLDRAATIAEKFVGQPDHPDAVIDVDALSAPVAPRVVLTDVP